MAKKTQTPKRKLWLDQRTHRNLRDSCGAIVLAVHGADGPVAWYVLTERILEMRFGRIRSSFASGNVSCGEYWRSSAVQMRRELTKWQNSEPLSHAQDSGKMSDRSFVEIANQAFDAAAKLSAICAGLPLDDFLALVRTARTCPQLQAAQANDDCEDPGENTTAEPQLSIDATAVIEHIRNSQNFDEQVTETVDVEKVFPACSDSMAMKLEETAAGKHSDSKIGEATDAMCNPKPDADHKEVPQEVAFQGRLMALEKTTLHGFVHKWENFDSMATDLYMLLCYMRLAPKGCDSGVINNPLLARSNVVVRVSKWHNAVRHQIAMMEMQEKMPSTKTSREEGWVRSTEKLKEKLAPSLPSSVSIDAGQVVAAWNGHAWCPGVVLAVWRLYKKGNGSQLTAREAACTVLAL